MGNVRPSSLKELHFMLQLDSLIVSSLVCDAMDEPNNQIVAPEHDGEGVVVATVHNVFACRKQIFIFAADVAEVD